MKWYAKDLNNIADQGLIIDEETGKNIAVAYDKKDMDLIAAAPELLEACQYALDNLAVASRDNLITAPKWFHVQLSETRLILDNAIQKVKGEK